MLLFPQQKRVYDCLQKVRWREMRCVRCGRLLQKVEQEALRPGKRLEIKCPHCKVVNYLTGDDVSLIE